MDLALQLGQPLGVIARMSERELGLWARYASQKGMPLRRLEYGLALISKMIAETMGGAENVDIANFLFDAHRIPDDEPHELSPEEWRELQDDIGFGG